MQPWKKLEIYSDVDLYVVINDHAELGKARSVARAVVADYPLAGDTYTFLRGPDVGIYSSEDLMTQPARPGTVDIATNHRVLYGDPALPAETAKHIGREIHPAEGLYLIENRLNELEGHRGRSEEAATRFTTFLACKTCVDVVAATLVAHGRYGPGRRDRKRTFESLVAGGILDGRFESGQLELIEKCHSSLEALPAPFITAAGSLSETITSVVTLALEEWKRIAADCLPGDSGDWRSLVLKRCHEGEYVHNFRQFLAISGRCGVGRAGSVAAGLHLARYSPTDTLRVSTLVEQLRENVATRPEADNLTRTLRRFLDRLTRTCGFSLGSLADRTREMHRAIQ